METPTIPVPEPRVEGAAARLPLAAPPRVHRPAHSPILGRPDPARLASALLGALPEEAKGLRPEDLLLAEPITRACRECRQPFLTSARARWVCDACVDERRRRIDADARRELLRGSGLGGRLAAMSLAAFDPRWQPDAYDAVCALLRPGRDLAPLTLIGRTGVGKTHLACGFLLRCLEYGLEGRYVSMPDLVTDYSTAADFRDWGSADLQPLYRAPVLVLDDLGDEKRTPVLASLLLSLIDRRWRSERPTIVTSRLDLEALTGWVGEKVMRRLVAEGEAVVMRDKMFRPERRPT